MATLRLTTTRGRIQAAFDYRDRGNLSFINWLNNEIRALLRSLRHFVWVIVGIGGNAFDIMARVGSWSSQSEVRLMRFILLAAAMFVLGACGSPMPSSSQKAADGSDLNRFIEPTNGSAYSQGSLYYYTAGGVGR